MTVWRSRLNRLKDEAAKFGSSTVNIEMARANLKQLESIYWELNNEREKAKVELQAAPRICLSELAEVPTD